VPSITIDRTANSVPKRSRQTAHNTKNGSCAGLAGRVAPVPDDLTIAVMPELAKEVAPTELVAVEHLLGPALLDLLTHRDRDSIAAQKYETRDAET
jgi:hypothetical protein